MFAYARSEEKEILRLPLYTHFKPFFTTVIFRAMLKEHGIVKKCHACMNTWYMIIEETFTNNK